MCRECDHWIYNYEVHLDGKHVVWCQGCKCAKAIADCQIAGRSATLYLCEECIQKLAFAHAIVGREEIPVVE